MAIIAGNTGAYSIIGAQSFRALVLPLTAGSYTVSGTVATLIRGYRIIALQHSYNVNGIAINTNRIAGEPGSYGITGRAAVLVTGSQRLNLNSGIYGITSTTAALQRSVPSERGSYAVTGTVAVLTRSGDPILTIGSGTYTLSVVPASLLFIQETGTGDYLVTGADASLRRGKGIGAFTRLLTLTGTAATLKRGRLFASANGTYALTGLSAILQYSSGTVRTILAETRTYTTLGVSANLIATRKISVTSGTYTITGQATALTAGAYVSGNYIIVGPITRLTRSARLVAGTGSYAVTGNANGLNRAIATIVAATSAYALAGLATTIRVQRVCGATGTSFAITGSPVFLRATRLNADTVAYTLTGTAVGLSPSRTGRWRSHPRRIATNKIQPRHSAQWETQDGAPGIEV